MIIYKIDGVNIQLASDPQIKGESTKKLSETIPSNLEINSNKGKKQVMVTSNQTINDQKTFNKDDDVQQIDLGFHNQNIVEQKKEKPKQTYTGVILKNKFMFWLMVNHAAFSDFILAYNLGLFNTLADHMNFIYNWTEEEKTLHYSLINSLPQAVAAIVSLFIGSWAARFGRRKMLIVIFIIAMIGNAITLIADTAALQIGRIIVGFCFGGISSIGPLYSIEIACKQYKGISGIIYSLYFGFGILLAFLLGYGLPSDPAESATNSYWRLMYGLPILLSFLHILMFIFVFKDETAPYIYIHDKDEAKTKRVLNNLFVEEVANEEYADLSSFVLKSNSSNVGWKQLFGVQFRSRVVLIICLTLGFSYVGCNAINIYSFNIIKESQGASTAQLFTAIMPVGDIVGPFFAFLLIDKIGRKYLYLNGLIGCMITLLAFSITGFCDYKQLQKYLILLYKLIFASSVAPVHWIYPSEVLPPIGVGFFGFSYWCASLSTVQFLPYFLERSGAEITILVFPIVTVFVMFYLMAYMKETTGKGKEQIENMFYKFIKLRESGHIVHSQHILSDHEIIDDEKQSKKP